MTLPQNQPFVPSHPIIPGPQKVESSFAMKTCRPFTGYHEVRVNFEGRRLEYTSYKGRRVNYRRLNCNLSCAGSVKI